MLWILIALLVLIVTFVVLAARRGGPEPDRRHPGGHG